MVDGQGDFCADIFSIIQLSKSSDMQKLTENISIEWWGLQMNNSSSYRSIWRFKLPIIKSQEDSKMFWKDAVWFCLITKHKSGQVALFLMLFIES